MQILLIKRNSYCSVSIQEVKYHFALEKMLCCSKQAFTFTHLNQQVVGDHEGVSYRKGQINYVKGLFYSSVLLFSM